MKKITFTVTNDLTYDQRMQRICTSLAGAGFAVLLVGKKNKDSVALEKLLYEQKRLTIIFDKGFLFYAEYNLRLFFYLFFLKFDAVCAIDLDTILPCLFVSSLKRKKRVYDAHELFTEMKEIITRPAVKKVWLRIEKFSVPKFKNGYTVSHSIAAEFYKRYRVQYSVIRNLPLMKALPETTSEKEKIILYQGAVNEARGLENLIIAMKNVNAVLHIYGDGNIFQKIKKSITENNVQQKVILKGKVTPDQLFTITQHAYIGINLVEPVGLNQFYSLANKFFDYVQACVPQLTMNFPEYKKINDVYKVALLADTIDVNEITVKLNELLNNTALYEKLKNNCLPARAVLNWNEEEKNLIDIYKNLFNI